MGNQKKNESPYVKLARKSLEHFVRTNNYLEIEEESDIQRGVFVTLKKDESLRGCIGTIIPTTSSIEKEIVQNAVSAGVKDPRFPMVREDELEEIDYSVDVLSEAETVTSLDALDVNQYGIIVTYGSQRGLLLPNLEGVNTIEKQLAIALDKAGIDPNDDYEIERFKVTRYY